MLWPGNFYSAIVVFHTVLLVYHRRPLPHCSLPERIVTHLQRWKVSIPMNVINQNLQRCCHNETEVVATIATAIYLREKWEKLLLKLIDNNGRVCCLRNMFENFLHLSVALERLVVLVGQRVLVCVDILCNIIMHMLCHFHITNVYLGITICDNQTFRTIHKHLLRPDANENKWKFINIFFTASFNLNKF